MSSYFRKLFRSTDDTVVVEDPKHSSRPYIISSIFYIAVVLMIGLPMWFYTCSTTRYSLPNLSTLDRKLQDPTLRLQLDLSVILFPNRESYDHDLAVHLRTELPIHLETNIENVTYNINWRIRRPTQDEVKIFKATRKQSDNNQSFDLSNTLKDLDQNLVKIHRPTNRFRLFFYVLDEDSAVCQLSSQTYIYSFERFVHICPKRNHDSIVDLIQTTLRELYTTPVDPKRIKSILPGQTDLLVSLVPEPDELDTFRLDQIADQVMTIHRKNVKEINPELTEVLNMKLITQNVFELLDKDLFSKILKKPMKQPLNKTITILDETRYIEVDNIGKFFHNFKSRINKHSSQNVNHVVVIVPDKNKPRLSLRQASGQISFLIGPNFDSILIANDDRALVLALRAIIRRLVGLSSADLPHKCQAYRHVFINRWEVDALVGALTIHKLHSTARSLHSISQQSIVVRIPRYVAAVAREARDSALESIQNLEANKNLESYRMAGKAYQLSESAYYDPHLLETNYFPDELKYAIYLPLFLPLVIPFFLSFVRVVKFSLQSLTH